MLCSQLRLEGLSPHDPSPIHLYMKLGRTALGRSPRPALCYFPAPALCPLLVASPTPTQSYEQDSLLDSLPRLSLPAISRDSFSIASPHW